MSVPSFFYELSGGSILAPGTTAPGKALPQGRDLAIDINPDGLNDLLLMGGDLVLVADLAAIEQEILIRLQFIRGEWFLDTTAGLPYFDNILVKAPNLAAIRTIFVNEILASAGIKSVLSLELDFDRKARTLTVTFSANTDVGQLDSSLVL
jgi:hypothetical protein